MLIAILFWFTFLLGVLCGCAFCWKFKIQPLECAVNHYRDKLFWTLKGIEDDK